MKYFAGKYSSALKMVLLYYLGYSIFFAILHLSLLSVFSFFHFLLDHDMSTIENWLNRNSWEILSTSKLISGYSFYKIVHLNQYSNFKINESIKKFDWIPSEKIIGVIVFILVLLYAFIVQFGGGVAEGQFKEGLFYSSFIGAFIYFYIDFLLLSFLMMSFKLESKDLNIVMYTSLLIFLLVTKIALPYLNKFHIFLVIHFLTLFFLGRKNAFKDAFYYALLVIGPLSSIYGLDIVWDNAYSLFSYQKELPIFGIAMIWSLAISYYHYSRAD